MTAPTVAELEAARRVLRETCDHGLTVAECFVCFDTGAAVVLAEDRLGCTHGMPSKASCTECMYEGPVAPLARPVELDERDGQSRLARFSQRCPACDGRIEAGDLIVHTTSDRWVHEGCAD